MTQRTSGSELIAEERAEQIRRWGDSHDDEHDGRELWDAARCYLAAARFADMFGRPMDTSSLGQEGYWPWEAESWKPSDEPIRNLVKAGALIAAEIDRLQRSQP